MGWKHVGHSSGCPTVRLGCDHPCSSESLWYRWHSPSGLPARGESWRHDAVMVPLLPEVSRCWLWRERDQIPRQFCMRSLVESFPLSSSTSIWNPWEKLPVGLEPSIIYKWLHFSTLGLGLLGEREKSWPEVWRQSQSEWGKAGSNSTQAKQSSYCFRECLIPAGLIAPALCTFGESTQLQSVCVCEWLLVKDRVETMARRTFAQLQLVHQCSFLGTQCTEDDFTPFSSSNKITITCCTWSCPWGLRGSFTQYACSAKNYKTASMAGAALVISKFPSAIQDSDNYLQSPTMAQNLGILGSVFSQLFLSS